MPETASASKGTRRNILIPDNDGEWRNHLEDVIEENKLVLFQDERTAVSVLRLILKHASTCISVIRLLQDQRTPEALLRALTRACNNLRQGNSPAEGLETLTME